MRLEITLLEVLEIGENRNKNLGDFLIKIICLLLSFFIHYFPQGIF